jgi:signal transduction histidine kinase
VEREVGRLNRLLTEFLDLARPRELAREPIHLATLIEGIVELESAAAAEAGVRVVADLPSDGCVALGDSGKLKQVLLNLVVNAVEAMRSGGTLRIALRCAAGHASICVADTGPGIAAPIREQVFEPFFTTKEGGTGLGLSIVRKIVDQHGGTIRIVCPPSGGTEVEVTIPTGIPRA